MKNIAQSTLIPCICSIKCFAYHWLIRLAGVYKNDWHITCGYFKYILSIFFENQPCISLLAAQNSPICFGTIAAWYLNKINLLCVLPIFFSLLLLYYWMWCCDLLDFWKRWYVTTMISFTEVPGFYRRKEERKANSRLGCSGRLCQQVEGGDSSLCSMLVRPHLAYCVRSGLPGARKVWTNCSESNRGPWGWLRTWNIWHTRRSWDSLEKTRCSLVSVSVGMSVNKVGCSNFPNKPKILSGILHQHLEPSEKNQRLISPFWKFFHLKWFQRSNSSSLHRSCCVRSLALAPLSCAAILSCTFSRTELIEFHSSE